MPDTNARAERVTLADRIRQFTRNEAAYRESGETDSTVLAAARDIDASLTYLGGDDVLHEIAHEIESKYVALAPLLAWLDEQIESSRRSAESVERSSTRVALLNQWEAFKKVRRHLPESEEG